MALKKGKSSFNQKRRNKLEMVHFMAQKEPSLTAGRHPFKLKVMILERSKTMGAFWLRRSRLTTESMSRSIDTS